MIVLNGVKPSGKAVLFSEWFTSNGLGAKTRAFTFARSEKCPPTFYVGKRRMIDEAVGAGYMRAVASGQIVLTTRDLDGE